MRYFSYLVTLLVAVFITACGGGGGSAGAVPGGPSPLAMFTTVPSGLTLTAGSNGDFAIGGGVAPFTAVSNNSAVVTVAVNGTALVIGGVSPGTADITIRDAVGTALTVTVNVNTGSTRPLFTTAPATITLTPGIAGTQTYLVGGGAKPYLTPSSSNAAVASVTLSADGTLTLTGLSPGTSNITIMDSLGATLTLVVTVPTVASVPLFTTAPSPVTLAIGSSTVYAVGGGSLPYTSATSSNTGVARATLGTNSVTIDALTAGNANVVVRDSAGETSIIAVIVPQAAITPLFSTAPSPLTVAIGTSPQYTIGGGVGSYTVTSSAPSIATVSHNTTTHVITINGLSAGAATIAVRDGAGTVLPILVTVPAASTVPLFTTAPANVTVAVDAHPQFDIGGGTGPYTVASSNTSFVTASIENSTKLMIDGVAVGTANVVVRDKLGQAVTVVVTVPTATTVPLFTTAPSTGMTVLIGASAPLTIGGGSGTGYTATSNNLGVATVSAIDPTTHVGTITGVATGDATIVVRDSVGATVNVLVHVPPAGSVALFTTAPASITLASSEIRSFNVGGGSGSGNYNATSSNASVATAAISGTSTLTITATGSGSADVFVGDSIGSTPVKIVVTVLAPPLGVNPVSATALIGDVLYATISGGKPNYTAFITNAAVADVKIGTLSGANFTEVATGNILQVTVKQQTLAVPVVITDALGATTSFTLTSGPGQPQIQLSPSALTISEFSNNANGTITLLVFGNNGDISAFSSNLGLLQATVHNETTPKSVVVTTGPTNRCVAVDTNVTISVIDSTNALATSVITIKDNGLCP